MAGALYRGPHSACTNRLPCSNCCAVHVLLSSRVPMHRQPRRPPPVAACPTQAPPAAAARRSPACGPAPSECGWRSGPSLQGPDTRRGACGPGQKLAQHGRVLETARTAWCTAAPHPRGPPAPERGAGARWAGAPKQPAVVVRLRGSLRAQRGAAALLGPQAPCRLSQTQAVAAPHLGIERRPPHAAGAR